MAGLTASFSPTGRTQETVIWQIKFRRCQAVGDGTELVEAPLRQIACAFLQADLYQLYGYCPSHPALKQRRFWGVRSWGAAAFADPLEGEFRSRGWR